MVSSPFRFEGGNCAVDARPDGLATAGQCQAGDRARKRQSCRDADPRRESVGERRRRGVTPCPGEDGDDECDSEDAAELAHHAVDTCSLADCLDSQRADNRVLSCRNRQ